MTEEDFQNDYVETDPATYLAAVTTKASWTALIRNITAHFAKDFGAGYFSGDLDVAFDFRLSDVEAGDATSRHAMLGILILYTEWATDFVKCTLIQIGDTDDVFYIVFQSSSGGVSQFLTNGTVQLAIDTTYYARLTRTGTSYKFAIYGSDSDRASESNAIDAITETGVADAFRRVWAVRSSAASGDGNDHTTGWLDHVDLAYAPVVAPEAGPTKTMLTLTLG